MLLLKQTSLANPLAPPRYHLRIRPARSKPGSTIPSLEFLRDELDATMGMCGRPTIADIDRDVIGTVPPLLGMFPQQWDTFRY